MSFGPAVNFTPLTYRGSFYWRTGIAVPFHAEVSGTSDTELSFSGDSHSTIRVKFNKSQIDALLRNKPPWTNVWKKGIDGSLISFTFGPNQRRKPPSQMLCDIDDSTGTQTNFDLLVVCRDGEAYLVRWDS